MTPLSEEQLLVISRGHCPDCGHRGFVLGPQGGAAINIECGACANRFNVARAPWGKMVWGERIDREDDGGSKWS